MISRLTLTFRQNTRSVLVDDESLNDFLTCYLQFVLNGQSPHVLLRSAIDSAPVSMSGMDLRELVMYDVQVIEAPDLKIVPAEELDGLLDSCSPERAAEYRERLNELNSKSFEDVMIEAGLS